MWIILLLTLTGLKSHGQILATDVPQLINYQGYLADANGDPINGEIEIQFSIYATVEGGSPLWTETQTVAVIDGLFNALLGSTNTLEFSVFDSRFRYLAIKVGDDLEMTPRKQLVSVGFAYRANSADKLKGREFSEFVQTVDGVPPKDGDVDLVAGENVTITPDANNNQITISATGGVGPGGDDLSVKTVTASEHIKTGSPTSSYVVGDIVSVNDVVADGDVRAGGTVAADNNSSGNAGHIGGVSYGAYGKHNSSGNYGYLGGVFGIAGVHGSSGNNGYFGSSNYGAYGKHSASQNVGYLGGGSYGAFGTHNGTANYGYLGSSNYGAYGKHQTSANFGYLGGEYGVYGKHEDSGNYGYIGGPLQGVYGSSHVDNGRGVEGFSSKAEGVFGFSQDFHGVHGLSIDTYGVYGRNLNGNFGALGGSDCGIYSGGDLVVTGAYRGDIGPNNGAPFPRPAYDSGWLTIQPGRENSLVLNHNLGGNPDNYVVDLQFQHHNMGVHQVCYGGDYMGQVLGSYGGWWKNLTDQEIILERNGGDHWVDKMRVRIWVYK